MAETTKYPDVTTLPLAPKNPLPYWRRLTAARRFDTGPQELRNAGGAVTRNILGPKWITPPLVFVSSPRGARDVLGRTDAFAERGATPVSLELRRLIGDNVLVVPHDQWLPRRRALQPIFTKQYVARFTGHLAEVAEDCPRRWIRDGEVDLDTECRTLTLQALGRTVLGVNLGGRTEAMRPALRAGANWAAGRALRPVNLPRWLPTRTQRRARAASAALHELAADILRSCRTDPGRDAPLVRALLDIVDPLTGEPLSDGEICDELVLFMLAGHETTSTTLTYALWALGRHGELQERVAAEVDQVGDRPLTSEDVPRLRYTVQVLHEALRLCPPAPVVGRTVVHDIEVDGYRLKAGTFAVIAIYAMHRDPTLWENPLIFDPDRFTPQQSKARDRWQYLPFGGGPRACIGGHFAMLEATLALATIIRRAEIHSLQGDFPTATPLTVVAAEPIRARVRPRQ